MECPVCGESVAERHMDSYTLMHDAIVRCYYYRCWNCGYQRGSERETEIIDREGTDGRA